MTAIFGELLSFSQEKGPDIRLKVFGDEFYARYETPEGYSVIYDQELGLFVYALLQDGRFVSSGVNLGSSPPPNLALHLEEDRRVQTSRAESRFPKR
ncbi:Uncharacterised protein [uncultured archaeon]|nr:Uncharacterised protein [uncultured archaeon]